MKFVKRNKPRNGEGSEKTISGYSNSSSGSSTSNGTSLESHSIWGLLFNGTNDVFGDMLNVGNITASGDIQTDGKIIIKLIDDEGNLQEGGLTISVEGNDAKFSGEKSYAFDNDLYVDTDLYTLGNATIYGNADLYNDLNVSGDASINGDLTVDGETNLSNVISDNITNSDTIKTKNLEVTGKAHFFELVIDKVKAAGGAVLFTPANGFNIDKVEAVTNGYKLYWLADDGEGNLADNMWKVNDLALCQSFNLAKNGTNHNVTNKYYWCLVTAVSSTTVAIDGKNYHYIVISTITKDGTVNPEVGDSIAMLGYRGTDDSNRLSAIYISAYSSLDSGLKAPLLAQYKGINDFNLKSHRLSYFDATGAKFVGNFEVAGLTIEDYINSLIDGAESGTPYIGTNGNWYIWDSDKKVYKDSGILAKGLDGTNGTNGKDGKDGENGLDGTSITITSTSIMYAIGNSATITPTSGWTASIVATTDVKPYLWTRTIVNYSDGKSTTSYSVSYKGKDGANGKDGTNGKDGIDGTNGKDGDKGTDAILYKLLPTEESALVTADSKLTIKLGYIIYQQIGDAKTLIESDSYTVRYIANNESTYHLISLIGSVYSLTSTANYSQEDYLTVELLKSGSIYDTRIVPIRFAASASLTINLTLGQISTKVTNNETAIGTNTNDISSLTLRANSIESTVSNHTTSINTINGKVSSNLTDISNLKQTASSLTSTISSVRDEIYGDNLLSGLNGEGWTGSFNDDSTSFELLSSTDWIQSPPIADFTGDYLFSFNKWNGDANIAIYEFDLTYSETGSYNVECDFKTYDVCTIYKSTLNASATDIANTYGASGNSNTYTITDDITSVKSGDTVAIQIYNTTTAKNNFIYGTVSSKASSTLLVVTATAILLPARLVVSATTATVYDDKEINKLHKTDDDRFWIRWNESLGTTRTFVIRMKNVNSTHSNISKMMLEESVEYLHKYSGSSKVTLSMIKLSADEIKMLVNDTFVKIGDGNITLNGDTLVNGALTLTSSDLGFILSGGNGVTEIMPKSIGDYDTFLLKSSRTIRTNGNFLAIGSEGSFGSASSESNISFLWTVRQPLGKMSKGSYILLTNYSANVRVTDSGTLLGYPTAIFRFYEDGVLKSTLDTVKVSSKNPLGNYTTSAEAEITVVAVFSYSTTSSVWESSTNSSNDKLLKFGKYATLGVGWTNILPTSAYMLIGYDGIAVNFGSNKSAFIGSEAAIFNYGNYLLKISDKGISKLNRRNIYVVRGAGTSSAPITYAVQDPIDTVLCIATNSKVIFPSNPYDGQEIKIFDKSSENCYVNSNGKYVVPYNGYGTGTVYTDTELPNRASRVYTYMNDKWYEEYTG